MKENLRRLQLIFRFTRLKPEMFYCIYFDGYEISLQGRPENIDEEKLKLFKFVRDQIQPNWYLRNGIRIVRL